MERRSIMKRIFFICVLLLSITFFFSNQSFAANEWNVNTNFAIGAKALDETDWEPVESQDELGLSIDFAPKTWPFSIEIGFLASATEEKDFYYMDVEGSTTELRAGIKKIWEPTTTMRPYVGGGLAIINAELKLSDSYDEISVDDQGVGGYVSGGIFWTIARHLNLGFELGYSKATVTLADYDGEAGGGHALFFVGYHW
jgi:hypothetical protein